MASRHCLRDDSALTIAVPPRRAGRISVALLAAIAVVVLIAASLVWAYWPQGSASVSSSTSVPTAAQAPAPVESTAQAPVPSDATPAAAPAAADLAAADAVVDSDSVSDPVADPSPAVTVARPAGTRGPTDPGAMGAIPPNINAQVADVARSLDPATRNPAGLSAMQLPEPFDRAAYEANPQAYANQVRPGRAFQPAQPGPDVPLLRVLGSRHQTLVSGASLPLVVRTEPGMPVTFTSMDLGHFENQLTSMTVIADHRGLAKVSFVASPGTSGFTAVIAASPVASGSAHFQIETLLPGAAFPDPEAQTASAPLPASADTPPAAPAAADERL